MATNLNSQEIRLFNWLITNIYMYFVNRLIKLCSFFLDRNFNKVEVVIARLVIRSRINDNLSYLFLGINGKLRRRLASACLELAVRIPIRLLTCTGGFAQQLEPVAVAARL